MRPPVPIAALLGLLLGSVVVGAGQDPPEFGDSPAAPVSQRRLTVFPPDELYPLYIADPHAPAAGILIESYRSTGIDGAGNTRFFLKLGGQFGLLRWQGDRNRAWQLTLDAGLDAQFDIDHRLDNIGWDGNYGLSASTARPGDRWALKLGLFHTSSHLGDEWIQRTGRRRLNYSRQEVLAGLRWHLTRRWDSYLESGWAYDMGGPGMEPARLQGGVEFRAPGRFWDGLGGWYAAVDLSSWEEREWRLDTGAQAGLLLLSSGRVWRLGLQYWDGRVPLGEFFRDTETSFAIGLWSEL